MENNNRIYLPAEAIHPGEILKDEIKARNMSQRTLAKRMGIEQRILHDIITSKLNLNSEIAALIGLSLEMDSQVWLNLQTNYEYEKKMLDAGKKQKRKHKKS
jgi:addiction module HigA family antidote